MHTNLLSKIKSIQCIKSIILLKIKSKCIKIYYITLLVDCSLSINSIQHISMKNKFYIKLKKKR